MKWGLMPVGLLVLGMSWLAWNVGNPAHNEIIVPAVIIEVQANAPTVQFIDVQFETQTLLADAERNPPRIGDSREVILRVDDTAPPRMRNANPWWLVALLGMAGVVLVLFPFVQLVGRLLLGGGGLFAGWRLAKWVGAADTRPSSGSVSSDIQALSQAARNEYSDTDSGLRSAGKEVAGVALVTEGVIGIENPFSSRNRGGAYSSLLGVMAGIGLLLYSPLVSALLVGEPDDVRVEGSVIEWSEHVSTDDDGETRVSWQPTYSYTDPATGIEYRHASSFNQNSPGALGEVGTLAYAPDNPGSAIVVQEWGRWVRPGLRSLAALIILASLFTLALRVGALVVGLRLLSSGKAERSASGDERSTLAVIRDSASDIIQSAEAKMPTSRGSVLGALVAIRREGRQRDAMHLAKGAVGATLVADSLFGLERPFDGENTRLGIFGNGLMLALCIGLGVFGLWLSNEIGYIGDRSTAIGEVLSVNGDDAVIEYVDQNGQTWSIIESESGDRAKGQQVQVAFEPNSPEDADVVSKGAPAIRWLLIGTSVLGVLALVPKVLLQIAGLFVGLKLLVGMRRPKGR